MKGEDLKNYLENAINILFPRIQFLVIACSSMHYNTVFRTYIIINIPWASRLQLICCYFAQLPAKHLGTLIPVGLFQTNLREFVSYILTLS